MAVNVEAERKVTHLNEEIQGLARAIRTKDQTIQESNVKIELMERRMEGVKKQGELIGDLEAELQKARKQERAYEEAMEQLQSDLDALEQETKRLKDNEPGLDAETRRKRVRISSPSSTLPPKLHLHTLPPYTRVFHAHILTLTLLCR